jgi:hypothetical protein
VVGDPARRRPTDDDRHEAIETALNGFAGGDDPGDVAACLAAIASAPQHVSRRIAARPRRRCDRRLRQPPLEFEDVRERYLADGIAHTKAQQHKSEFALRAAAMLHGGVDPGLLDEVQWWRTDDLWYWSLEGLAAYVRAAADRSRQSAESAAVGSPANATSQSPATTLRSGAGLR